MLTRVCSGGVVFAGEKVLILKNDKDEWVLPKGVIRPDKLAQEVAVERIKTEADVNARIVTYVGETRYEFYSITRQRPVTNLITWFLMEAGNDTSKPNEDLGFKDGGFYSMEEAAGLMTHNQEKSLVRLSFQKMIDYREKDEAFV